MNYLELEEHFSEIEKMYLEDDLTPSQIGEQFNSKRYQINYILKKYGIQKSISESKRKYTLNESYFDEIDTPNKAYILGFLYADGYNNRINNSVVLSLSKEDREILEKISEEVGSNKPLFESDYVNKNDGTERHMLILTMASKHMCEALEKWGLTQNKTFIITFPDFLKEDLIPHFVRGYFDGDGCACSTFDKGRPKFQITLMSSTQFCNGLINYLETQNIHFHINQPFRKSEKNKIVRSGSNKELPKFINLIYKDADLYLNRKRNKCYAYLETKQVN